jgi:cystathionine beta-lyase
MVYNFDEILNRRGTDSVKWDGMKEQFGREDLISMWVADMDFRTPPCVIRAIQERLEAGVLGYTLPSDQWYNAIIRWVDTQHQWGVKAEEIIHMPGIVRGLAFALQCFTKVHDRVMVMPPVYHPFFLVTEKNHREVVYSPLHLNDDDEVVIDFEQFERDIEGCRS